MRFLEIIKNKKSIFIIKIIAIFLLLSYIIFFAFNKSSNIEYSGRKLVDEKEYQKEKEIFEKKDEVDTDGDGLLDWEEVLYNTDINKEDSDGDGVSDYDEISLGQDPLVSGKGDSARISENIVKKDGIVQVKKEITNKKRNNDEYLKAKKKLESLKKNNKKKYNEIEERNKILKKQVNKIASAEMALAKMGNSKVLADAFDRTITGKIKKTDYKILSDAAIIFESQYKAYGYVRVENNQLSTYLSALKQAYKKSAEGMNEISEYDYKKSVESKEYNNILKNYTDGILDINKALSDIHKFVINKNLKFSNGEAGKFFEFSL